MERCIRDRTGVRRCPGRFFSALPACVATLVQHPVSGGYFLGDTVGDDGICAIDVRLCRVLIHATAASVPFTLKCSWKN